MEKEYIIYLFKSPECIRGWLAYIRPGVEDSRATFKVSVMAENGTKAKNMAITRANNEFKDLVILESNENDEIWGIKNFPDLRCYASNPLKDNT